MDTKCPKCHKESIQMITSEADVIWKPTENDSALKTYSLLDIHKFMQKLDSLDSYERFKALYVNLGFPFDSYIQEKYRGFHSSPSYWFCNLDHETQAKVLKILLK